MRIIKGLLTYKTEDSTRCFVLFWIRIGPTSTNNTTSTFTDTSIPDKPAYAKEVDDLGVKIEEQGKEIDRLGAQIDQNSDDLEKSIGIFNKLIEHFI